MTWDYESDFVNIDYELNAVVYGDDNEKDKDTSSLVNMYFGFLTLHLDENEARDLLKGLTKIISNIDKKIPSSSK